MIRVGVNGFGTIGKRVADAVSLQDDMQLVGVTMTKPSFKFDLARKLGYKVFSATSDTKNFQNGDIAGTIEDLVRESDIIIDCSPEERGPENRKLYQQHGKKAIFQGGEEAEIAEASFVAQANYDEARGKQFVRVVSCNTTGLSRTLSAIDNAFGIDNAYAVLVRRATDPGDSKKGPINAISPETEMPSHHGPDVKTVLPYMPIFTSAVKASTTLMHLHVVSVKLKKEAARDDIIKLFESTPRVILIDSKKGFSSTAEIMEYARDLGRKRGDLYEIAIWKDSINVKHGILYFMQAVHQESDVVPENIDCIRAMFGSMGKEESISKTNMSLSIEK